MVADVCVMAFSGAGGGVEAVIFLGAIVISVAGILFMGVVFVVVTFVLSLTGVIAFGIGGITGSGFWVIGVGGGVVGLLSWLRELWFRLYLCVSPTK